MVSRFEDRVGRRAMGRFAEGYRAKGCPVGKDVDPAKKLNERWRRISGITVDIEECMDAKERRVSFPTSGGPAEVELVHGILERFGADVVE